MSPATRLAAVLGKIWLRRLAGVAGLGKTWAQLLAGRTARLSDLLFFFDVILKIF